MPWASSDRRRRLPSDWPAIRERVKRRAGGRCEADVHEPACDGTGSEADHVTPGDDHRMSNLQWLNSECHKAKTARENAAARAALAAALIRPTEAHPGAIRPPGG